jgi:uncharacterized protein involved in type VI secretion and phage assembly
MILTPAFTRTAEARDGARVDGVTVGVVTNNHDPDGLGRVKVRLAWASPEHETFWARMVTPMAGPSRGLFLLPEVDDEVLVAFEHGAMDSAFVLGALWNDRDRPPAANADGANNERILRSRSGHVIRLDDTDGQERIEIADGSGEARIVIRTAERALDIDASGDVTVRSGGTLTLQGARVRIAADTAFEAESSQALKLTAASTLTVKGAVVNIN